MGFMLLECGLGLYTLAALHLIGHSLYKAHAFLSASTAVQNSKLQMMRAATVPSTLSLIVAPFVALLTVSLVQAATKGALWPWWWSGVLALAWAPLLWLPTTSGRSAAEDESGGNTAWWRALAGVGIVAALTAAVVLAHWLPLGLIDRPHQQSGIVTLLCMAVMYLFVMTLQMQPQAWARLRRWSYAGFYVDEWFTTLALKLWPTRWTVATMPFPDLDRDPNRDPHLRAAGALSAAASK